MYFSQRKNAHELQLLIFNTNAMFIQDRKIEFNSFLNVEHADPVPVHCGIQMPGRMSTWSFPQVGRLSTLYKGGARSYSNMVFLQLGRLPTLFKVELLTGQIVFCMNGSIFHFVK